MALFLGKGDLKGVVIIKLAKKDRVDRRYLRRGQSPKYVFFLAKIEEKKRKYIDN